MTWVFWHLIPPTKVHGRNFMFKPERCKKCEVSVKGNFVHFSFLSSAVGVANSVLVLEDSVSHQECTYAYICI